MAHPRAQTDCPPDKFAGAPISSENKDDHMKDTEIDDGMRETEPETLPTDIDKNYTSRDMYVLTTGSMQEDEHGSHGGLIRSDKTVVLSRPTSGLFVPETKILLSDIIKARCVPHIGRNIPTYASKHWSSLPAITQKNDPAEISGQAFQSIADDTPMAKPIKRQQSVERCQDRWGRFLQIEKKDRGILPAIDKQMLFTRRTRRVGKPVIEERWPKAPRANAWKKILFPRLMGPVYIKPQVLEIPSDYLKRISEVHKFNPAVLSKSDYVYEGEVGSRHGVVSKGEDTIICIYVNGGS